MSELSNPDWTSTEALAEARRQTAGLLTAIPSFTGLTKEERDQMAADTVKVLSYMTDPDGVSEKVDESSMGLASVLSKPRTSKSTAYTMADENPVETTKRNLAQAPDQVGKDF